MRQATITFPGLTKIVRANVTWNRGVSPGQITVDTVPQTSVTSAVGNFSIVWADRLPDGSPNPLDADAVTITLYDCAIDVSTLEIRNNQTWSVTIFDRRWKWQYGEISGRYNVRNDNGSLDTSTEKTPQQLATLCLDAMGETGYDVSQIPNTARPEVNWDVENPAQALAGLCSVLRCEVVLTLAENNPVVIYPNGTGTALPTAYSQSLSQSGKVGQRPAYVRAVTQPILLQRRFKLRAVGLDTDDEVKALADLSYEPASGFQDEQFMDDVTTSSDAKKLAQKSVYRWFELATFADDTLDIPSISPSVGLSSLDSIARVRLTSGLIESQEIHGKLKPKEPRLYGTYFSHQYTSGTSNETDAEYPGDFSIDVGRGLVQLREPLVKMNGSTIEEPDLYLEIAFTIEDTTGALVRYKRDMAVDNPDSDGILLVRMDNIRRTVRWPYTAIATEGTVADNATTVNSEIDARLTQVVASIGADSSADALYGRIVPIELDGLRQQVVWSIGGNKEATTRAAVNKDTDPVSEGEPARKQKDKAKNVLEKNLAPETMGPAWSAHQPWSALNP